jgi:hypothetical protein
MSYSVLAIRRAVDFDNYFNLPQNERVLKKNINKKNTLSKHVYYYGLPKNENCDEYFSCEEKVLIWIILII